MHHYVGKDEDFPINKPKIVDINGVSIGVFKNEKGKYYAVRNLCPHRLAPLCKGAVDGTMLPSDPQEFQFGMEGQIIRCPWHGWEFNLDTREAAFGISSRKITTYPVEIKNGDVYVFMKERLKKNKIN